ncbi:MAG TPA: trypsin-like serine protease [Thermotogota bacterium]|nr:trypsin-like serine protease [Thermotogota bacterium]
MKKMKKSLEKQKAISAEQGAEFDKEIKKYITETRTKIKDDPNKKNATNSGDSGGSLICVKDKKHYLVGIPVNGYQSAVLLNDPAIWKWWSKL